MPVKLQIPPLKRRGSTPHRGSERRDLPTYLRLLIPAVPSGFETKDSGRRRVAELVGVLEKSDQPEALTLAQRLKRCRDKNPCLSAACAKCNRAFRLRLYQEALKAIPTNAEILALSLIPKAFRVELGELSLNLETWAKSRQRGLARALPAGALFIGGVDISLNTLENSDPHWCLHVYGFVILAPGWGVYRPSRVRLLRSQIEQHCPPIPKSERVGREVPLMIGPRSQGELRDKLLYGLKAQFYRRSRYGYVKRKAGKRSTNVSPQALRPAHRAELAVFLDEFSLGSRLILIGLRRRGHFARFSLHREGD